MDYKKSWDAVGDELVGVMSKLNNKWDVEIGVINWEWNDFEDDLNGRWANYKTLIMYNVNNYEEDDMFCHRGFDNIGDEYDLEERQEKGIKLARGNYAWVKFID